MRKLIIAATTIATLAVPAVSMAANTQTTRVDTPYTASYVDQYGTGQQTTCKGTHEVKTAKNPANSFVIDKFQCTLTSPTTGKPVAVFAPFASLSEANFGDGWASDYNGVLSTSLVGHANSKGTGFSAIATYPVGQ